MVIVERQQVGNNERRQQTVGRIGNAVSESIERFVSIGEVIAEDNLEIKSEIFNYCKSARDEGNSIKRLCNILPMDNRNCSSLDIPMYDKNTIITEAKSLLASITRILLLVDIVVVKQLLTAKKKNFKSIRKLESIIHFTEFVRAYSLFGIDMIELAYLMGTQQTKTKEERRRAQMFSAKQIVEHSIATLLTSSKTSLLHYDCAIAKENRDTVFCQIRRAMDLIHFVVKDCIFETPYLSFKEKSMYSKNADRDTVFSALKHFTILLESCRHQSKEDNDILYMSNNNITKSNIIPNVEKTWTTNNKFRNLFDREEESLPLEKNYKHVNIKSPAFINRGLDVGFVEDVMFAFDKLLEKTYDFTDSAYTSHENRENILIICDRCKTELNKYLNTLCSSEYFTWRHLLESEIDKVLCTVKDLIEQLIISVADQVVDLNYSLKSSVELVKSFRLYAINQDPIHFQECSNKFHDHCDHITDVCKLLRHIAFTETLQVQAKCLSINLRIYGPQVVIAAKILSKYLSSIPANENMDAFEEMWIWLTSEITCMAQLILDSTNKLMKSKSLKKSPATSTEESEKVSCSMAAKDIPIELASYNEKWNDELNDNNDIIKRAKNMSAMAFAMYQFTKGNGTLRTTQDLFTQAEYFAEEANRLYKVLRQFSYQVPASQNKKDLLSILDRVPTFVQTLQFTVKDHTVGKDATFVKVDHVIRETKNLMSVINKVVTRCFECANKYKLDLTGLSSGMSSSGALHGDDNSTGGMGDSKGTTSSSEGSM